MGRRDRAGYDEDDFGEEDGFEPYYSNAEDGEEIAEDTDGVAHAMMPMALSSLWPLLGKDAQYVTKFQAREALWHANYDVLKAATLLKNIHAGPPPKAFPTGRTTSLPPQTYFLGTPWINISQDRYSTLVEPPRTRGGLLGGGEGGPKLSKLQALAAARRQKMLDQKLRSSTTDFSSMSMTDGAGKENITPGGGMANQTASASEKTTVLETTTTGLLALPGSKPDLLIRVGRLLPDRPAPQHLHRISKPSAFARTVCSPTVIDDSPACFSPHQFLLPYASSSQFAEFVFSKPSPDDIVLEAQSKAGSKAVKPGQSKAVSMKDKASKAPAVDATEKELSALKIGEAAPKSKGLDVMVEYEKKKEKPRVSFVVVGHVDAGKSTLMGRLLLELKCVDSHTVDKYRRQAGTMGKESFALAWVMDQSVEERSRGVTIDIAMSHFETDKTMFTILDAPGHRDFIPNMIAGASQADCAILVIDSNTGAFEKGLRGQTREHVLLLRSLGVQKIVVAINKLDMVKWSHDRFDEISGQVTGFVTGVGYQARNISLVPLSGISGDNVVRRCQDPTASWYNGPTLIEALETFSAQQTARDLKKPFRMFISDIFRSKTTGAPTISGWIESGTVQVGDDVVCLPNSETAHIKSITVGEQSRDWAVAGQHICILLSSGADQDNVHVGDMLCPTKSPAACMDDFTLRALSFGHLMPMPVDLHRGRLNMAGQIESVVALLDKTTGEVVKKRPRIVQPGSLATLRIKLSAKIPLEVGQRIVLRSGGETIAAGLVES